MLNPSFVLCFFISFLTSPILFAATTGAEHQYGPTGILGVHSKNEITVGSVDKGSPADGKIAPGAKIIGVGNNKFKNDVRKELAEAIDIAESESGAGKLTLMIKGGNKVDLTLKVLGTYSATAPFNCPKTEAILKQAELVQFLPDKPTSKSKKPTSAEMDRMYFELLGKMALLGKDGTKEYTNYNWVSTEENSLFVTWSWGYRLMAMSEYYFLTGDEKVLPHIKTYAVGLAKGQDPGGLWGHQLATAERNGRLPGYAQMNQTSLSCLVGMLYAKKCGIDDSTLNAGIEKTLKYVTSYIDRGTFAYGVHPPNSAAYNNNGMSGSAAWSMKLVGHKEGTNYFSKLSLAAHNDLEQGHSTHFFNTFWTPLGASILGPEAIKKFHLESRWLYTMYRSWNGKITWDGEVKSNIGNVGAAMLVNLCLARKNLYLTGKSDIKQEELTTEKVQEIINLPKIKYDALSVEQLMPLVKHELPQVRRNAVWTIRKKSNDLTNFINDIIKNGSKREKIDAISFFGYGCPSEIALTQLENLGQILRDKTQVGEVRAQASAALSHMGQPALKFYNDMLNLLLENRPNDYVEYVDEVVGKSINNLCPNPYTAGVITDKNLFYKSALKLMNHKRQNTREQGVQMVDNIPMEEFHLVAEKLMYLIKDEDPTYHSYHNPGGAIAGAVMIFANLNIEEGLQYAMDIHDLESGKGSFKMKATWEALSKFGANAKPMLEILNQKYRDANGKIRDFGRHNGSYQAMVKAIENDPNPKKLIKLADALKYGK